jgi:hypothetical protein
VLSLLDRVAQENAELDRKRAEAAAQSAAGEASGKEDAGGSPVPR